MSTYRADSLAGPSPFAVEAPKEAMAGMAAELLVSAAEDGKFENKLADAVEAQETAASDALVVSYSQSMYSRV